MGWRKRAAAVQDRDILEQEIAAWKSSRRRDMQIRGFAYFSGQHDICARQRTAIGRDGKLERLENVPNHRLVNNQFGKLVTQKANYLLGKPFAMEGDNAEYIGQLRGIFDKRFLRLLKNLGKAMLCGGIAWLYPYYDETGALAFRMFPAYEILPFWHDSEHTQLERAVRVYLRERFDGRAFVLEEKVEVYSAADVQCLALENGRLVPDEDAPGAGVLPYSFWNGGAAGWPRVPLVPFKANAGEMPLLQRVKTLQDGLNLMLSDFENRMQEDPRNTILVLKNYDGADLGEFRRNLAQYGAVKVRTEGDAQGGVETLEVKFSAENYRVILSLLRDAVVENGMGFDARDARLSGNPNQMNIRSMYSDIDLDADEMETEMQASFEELLTFIGVYLERAGKASGGRVTFLFNRDMLMSESEAIANCTASAQMLSRETIVAKHPWVDDPQRELERLRRQEAAELHETEEREDGSGRIASAH